MGRDEKRAALLEAALVHVPFDGWSEAALRAGAEDLGWAPAEALRLFPRGAIEALDAFMVRADRGMVAAVEAADTAALRVPEKVALAIRLRFEADAAHREAIRRGVATLALPQHGPLALKSLYRTVDAVWFAIGDRSTDFNFYTKRMLLAGVYSTTLLYWLEDQSEGFADTWSFLDRRLRDVGQIPKVTGRVKGFIDGLPDPFRMMRPGPSRRP